jgi:hypothetical protein
MIHTLVGKVNQSLMSINWILIFIFNIGLQEALSYTSFKPQNQNVAHETDGLKTYITDCAQLGLYNNNYPSSWYLPIKARRGKQYYGRRWFQLSWPCKYYNAEQASGVDLLADSDQVTTSHKLACATAMDKPVREGNFGATTRIINKIECKSIDRQKARIKFHQKVRRCFGLEFWDKKICYVN